MNRSAKITVKLYDIVPPVINSIISLIPAGEGLMKKSLAGQHIITYDREKGLARFYANNAFVNWMHRNAPLDYYLLDTDRKISVTQRASLQFPGHQPLELNLISSITVKKEGALNVI